jgi:hypothetical protein
MRLVSKAARNKTSKVQGMAAVNFQRPTPEVSGETSALHETDQKRKKVWAQRGIVLAPGLWRN